MLAPFALVPSVVLSTEVIIHNALGLYAKTVEHLNDSV